MPTLLISRLRRTAILGLLVIHPTAAQQPPDVIRVGTKLVQVEVVVRDKDGPLTGLKRENFTLLDQGETRKIELFNSSSEKGPPPVDEQTSNRSNRLGHPIPGTTVLLIDQLN